MFGQRLREFRQASGMTQGELALRAGVSRQLVGAAEADRHLPRVDAAAALAAALGVSVEVLLRPGRVPVTPVLDTARRPRDGDLVHAAQVDDRWVCIPASAEGEAWAPATGVMRAGSVEPFEEVHAAGVIAGCDPIIGLVAGLLQQHGGPPILPVPTSSAAALSALSGDRIHGALVHGPEGDLPDAPAAETTVTSLRRIEVARWEVGLAAPADLPADWVARALTGQLRVVQRAPGATSQTAFERAVRARVGGAAPSPEPLGEGGEPPRASGHLDAAAWARRTGWAAVTIAPAAAAFDLAFHPLEEHVVELRVPPRHLDAAGIRRFLDELTGDRLRRRIDAIGGYDLRRSGVEVAA